MKFVDLVRVTVVGGDGGKGFSSFDRKKFMPNGGPNGGDGGRGGNVYLRVNSSFKSLLDLKIKSVYKAAHGNAGEAERKAGKDGKDLYLEVPKGCIISDEQGHILADLCDNDSCFLVAKGGIGGLGNTHFASSRFQAPTYAQTGKPGESRQICIELRLIADVALVGLPNAGKSSLLAALTDARPKIGDYAFTTLRPNLGVLKFIDQHITMADMPGLIEGACKGLGLGHDFLRHISRAACLIHVIAADKDEQLCYQQYAILMNELKASDYCVKDKPSFVVISKSDTLLPEDIKRIRGFYKQKGITAISFVSIYDKKRINGLKNAIQKLVLNL